MKIRAFLGGFFPVIFVCLISSFAELYVPLSNQGPLKQASLLTAASATENYAMARVNDLDVSATKLQAFTEFRQVE
jgi:hypothetical protein